MIRYILSIGVLCGTVSAAYSQAVLPLEDPAQYLNAAQAACAQYREPLKEMPLPMSGVVGPYKPAFAADCKQIDQKVADRQKAQSAPATKASEAATEAAAHDTINRALGKTK